MFQFLAGKRTYIVGGLMMLTALGLGLTGDMNWVDALKLGFDGAGFAGLRAGVAALPVTVDRILAAFEAVKPPATPSEDVQQYIQKQVTEIVRTAYTEAPDEESALAYADRLTGNIIARLARP